MTTQTSQQSIFRLTTLWALAESGLGGWMHALHLPFTGFFVGAFAVILISLIARYSQNSFRQVLQATILVIMVKAAVSPQSPPPAYLAVGFQGLLGACLFRIIPSFKIAAILLATLSMVESALQKIIVATVIFGSSLWQAIDRLFSSIIKELHLPPDTSFSFWIIAAYTGVYALWGLALGWWIGNLPARIDSHATSIIQKLNELPPSSIPEPAKPRKSNRFKKIVSYTLVLAFIITVLFSGNAISSRALYLILRTLAVICFLVFVINPTLKWLIQRRLSKASTNEKAGVRQIITALPEFRTWIRPAYQLASQHTGLHRFSRFVLVFLVISLYPHQLEK